ncbi:MAG: rhodanese-like domain-containing protein [Anaerolineae bacterium]
MTENNPNDFKNISIEQYNAQFVGKTTHTLVDVRTVEEYQQGRIPGAVNIPLDELSQRLGEIPQEVPVVVVCAHGVRSVYGSQIIRYAGFTEVYNLEGGTVAWWMRRLPLEG